MIQLAVLKKLPVATNYENDLTHRKPSATIADILLTIDYWEKNICTKTERSSYISINIWYISIKRHHRGIAIYNRCCEPDQYDGHAAMYCH